MQASLYSECSVTYVHHLCAHYDVFVLRHLLHNGPAIDYCCLLVDIVKNFFEYVWCMFHYIASKNINLCHFCVVQ